MFLSLGLGLGGRPQELARWIHTILVSSVLRPPRKPRPSPSPALLRTTKPATIHDLPGEILNYIIRLLRGDDCSLKACCLTSHSWLVPAQGTLHEDVHINCSNRNCVYPARYSSPKIAQYVHSLTVLELPPPIRYSPEEETHDTHVLVWDVLYRFTQLRRLTIHSMEWFCTQERRDILSATFSRVSSLRLCDIKFKHVHDFLFFMSAFPNISSLHLDGVSWSYPLHSLTLLRDYPRQQLDTLSAQTLRTLSFGCWYGDFPTHVVEDIVQHWLCLSPHPALCVKWQARTCVDSLPYLLRALGPSISSLDIGIVKGEPMLCIPDSGIQHCTELRSLVLRGSCAPVSDDSFPIGGRTYSDGTYSWLPLLLSDVHSCKISRVGFACALRDSSDIRRFSGILDVIDECLSRPTFRQLTEVSFSIDGLVATAARPSKRNAWLFEETQAQLVDMIWDNMPQMAGRNILHMHNGWEHYQL